MKQRRTFNVNVLFMPRGGGPQPRRVWSTMPSKRIRSREIAADDKFQFKRESARFKALHVVPENGGDVV